MSHNRFNNAGLKVHARDYTPGYTNGDEVPLCGLSSPIRLPVIDNRDDRVTCKRCLTLIEKELLHGK